MMRHSRLLERQTIREVADADFVFCAGYRRENLESMRVSEDLKQVRLQ